MTYMPIIQLDISAKISHIQWRSKFLKFSKLGDYIFIFRNAESKVESTNVGVQKCILPFSFSLLKANKQEHIEKSSRNYLSILKMIDHTWQQDGS